MKQIETAADVRPGQTLRDHRRTVIVGNEAFHTAGTERPSGRITLIRPDGERRYAGIESCRMRARSMLLPQNWKLFPFCHRTLRLPA